MTKAELLSHANGEIFEIEGVKLQAEITKCAGDDFLKIKMHPITPLHAEASLGSKWVKYITEKECAEFESEIKKHKEKALAFVENAKRVVKATLTADNRIKIIDLPDSVKKDWDFYENKEQKKRAIRQFVSRTHPIQFVNKEEKHFFALGHFTLNLDGVIYTPIWSYWLDRAVYVASPQIKELKELRK